MIIVTAAIACKELQPGAVYVIFTVPMLIPDTIPVIDVTEAIALLLLVQVPPGVPEALRVAEPPDGMVVEPDMLPAVMIVTVAVPLILVEQPPITLVATALYTEAAVKLPKLSVEPVPATGLPVADAPLYS